MILEKYDEVGGTWYEANYPGAACDIPSHFYSFSFYLSHRWTRKFSVAKEISNYLKEVTNHYNLYKKIKFNTYVTKSVWNEKTKLWEIYTKNSGDQPAYKCNFLIGCSGVLNIPNTPKFEDADKFKGRKCHSYNWPRVGSPDEINLEGKVVNLIGTGASAVQMVPAIANTVKQLNVFQRSPAWAPPRMDFEYPVVWKEMFQKVPFAMRFYRWFNFWFIEQSYLYIIVRGTKLQKKAISVLKHFHRKFLKFDKNLVDKMTPKYEPGCKRITPSDHYLQCFLKPNVNCITDPIVKFTETGIQTTKENVPADVIVYCTGFNMLKSIGWFDVYGVNQKQNMEELGGNAPKMYYGVTAPEFPNFFRLLGPNSGLAHNSVVFMIEAQIDYICDAIRKTVVADKKRIELKQNVLDSHYKYIYGQMPKRSFGGLGGCVGWYRNEDNLCWTMWPNSCVNYWWNLLYCEMTDYKLS